MISLGSDNIQKCRSNSSIKPGDKTVNSFGCVEVYLKTPAYMSDIPVVNDIVSVDVSARLWLNMLDAYRLFAETINNRLDNA